MSEIDDWKKSQISGDNPFGGSGDASQADRMLQIGTVNKFITPKLARLIIACRVWDRANPEMAGFLSGIADLAEQAMLNVEGRSRANFMDVAIKQWLGKIEAGKNRVGMQNLG